MGSDMGSDMGTDLEQRLTTIEDRFAIYNLIATHPLSADTGAQELIEAIYAEDATFDRGVGLSGAQGRDGMLGMVSSEGHRAAIAGGLAHVGNLPLVELAGDTATAISYIMLVTPDRQGPEQELPNHGASRGFRIHRVVANRWCLVRRDGRWQIRSRTALPMDGSGPALELLGRPAGLQPHGETCSAAG
jgi:hypothetical protein